MTHGQPRFLFALCLLLAAAPLGAQQDSLGDSLPPGPAGSPVILEGDTLFLLFANLGPFTPAQRAVAVSQRLREAASAIAHGRDSLQVVEAGGHTEILAGEVILMTVLEGDALPTGIARPALATQYAERILAAARETSARITFRAILIDSLFAVLATLVLVLIIWGLRRGVARLHLLADSGRLPALRIQRFELLSASRLRAALHAMVRGFRVLAILLVAYLYVTAVLSLFPWTAPYARRITGYVLTPIGLAWDGFVAYLPKLFFLLVIAIVTRYIIKFLRVIFQGLARGTLVIAGFYRDWAMPTFKIARLLVIALAAILMIPYLPGSGSDAFKGVSIFIGVLFSFGSSGAIGNLIAGVVLTYTRAFQVGDRVKINDTMGDVVERTLLVTRVRTIKNVDVTIPNGSVLGSHVVNYSMSASDRGLILNTAVTIGYDAPWRRVHELLIEAARTTPDIEAEPAPFVLQTALNDFYVSYEVNAYTRKPQSMAVIYSTLHQNIQDRFNEAGVEIMSPHYRSIRDGNAPAMPETGTESGPGAE